MSKHRYTVIMLGILALASFLRFAWLGHVSFWHDEIGAIELAREPGPRALIRSLIELDATRAPLHPLMLQGWIAIVGHSDFAARALSALFGIASVAMIYRLGRQLHSEAVGVVAAWLLALSPLAVHHSREVRMYSLLVFLTCLCWDFLLSFRHSAGLGKQCGFGLALTALVYAHPLGGLMVIALALGYLILRSESCLTVRAWFFIHVAVAAALGPWVIHYFDHPPQLFNRLSLRLFLEWPEAFTGGGREALTVCTALIFWGLWARTTHREPEEDPPAASRHFRGLHSRFALGQIAPDSLLLLAWYVIPVALLLAYSIWRYPVFGPRRYLLFVGPAYFLLLAQGIVALPRVSRLATILAATVVMIGALGPRAFDTYNERHDLKGLAAVVEARHPGALVVLVNEKPGLLNGIRYYLNPHTRSALASDLLQASHGPVGLSAAPALSEQGIWLVRDIAGGKVPEPILNELERCYLPKWQRSLTGFIVTYAHRRGDDQSALLEREGSRR